MGIRTWADALAAIGFATPTLIIIGLGNGLGTGANSLISRCIGANKHDKANDSAIHSIILSIIVSILLIFIFPFLKDLLILMGASDVLNYTLEYASIIILGGFVFVIPSMLSAIFRCEGAIERSSYPIMIGSILNIIFDPIFIYVLDLGIGGAAIATVLCSAIPLIPMCYWMFIKKDGELKIERNNYKRQWQIYKEILVVGIPASIEQLVMSCVSIVINALLSSIAGTTTVAAYTSAWRLISMGIVPAACVSQASLTVAGAAYGAKNYENLNTTLKYSVKIGLLSSILICIIFYLFSGQLAEIFSYTSSNNILYINIVESLEILAFFILPIAFGATAASMFQAMGKGTTSLILTALREFVFVITFAYLLSTVFNLGIPGVYIGMVIGSIVGSIFAYLYINYYMKKVKTNFIS